MARLPSYLAGKTVTVKLTLIRDAGDTTPIDPTVVTMYITESDGTLVEDLSGDVTVVYADDDSYAIATADWLIPDDRPSGTLVATVDTSGGFVQAEEFKFAVKARTYVAP